MPLRLIAVAGLLTALAAPSASEAAYTTGAVNVRMGPGTQYGVITTAPPGSWVNVMRCVPYWCRVQFAGISGWMSSAYIDERAPRYYPPPPPPPVYYPPPPPVVYYPPPPPPPYYYKGYPRPYPYYRQPRTYYGFSFGFSQ